MAKVGMDIGRVQAMGRSMQAHADEMRQMVKQLDGYVGQIPGSWSGADATRFADWWQGHRSSILNAAGDLHGLGQSALNNATEQADVSNR